MITPLALTLYFTIALIMIFAIYYFLTRPSKNEIPSQLKPIAIAFLITGAVCLNIPALGIPLIVIAILIFLFPWLKK